MCWLGPLLWIRSSNVGKCYLGNWLFFGSELFCCTISTDSACLYLMHVTNSGHSVDKTVCQRCQHTLLYSWSIHNTCRASMCKNKLLGLQMWQRVRLWGDHMELVLPLSVHQKGPCGHQTSDQVRMQDEHASGGTASVILNMYICNANTVNLTTWGPEIWLIHIQRRSLNIAGQWISLTSAVWAYALWVG